MTLPLDIDGVTRPLAAGVILPFEIDGVVRPPSEDGGLPDDGVTRPASTEGGLLATPAVAVLSFVVATKTPQCGGQVKYCFPPTLPSFFPFPAKPPDNSTPAHSPPLPSISPMNRSVPSNPRLSMRTLSPSSKACRLDGGRPAVLLGGLLVETPSFPGAFETGVFARDEVVGLGYEVMLGGLPRITS